MPSRTALIVASDRYDDAAFGPLRAPAHDVEALTRVLKDPSVGGFDVHEPLMNRPAYELTREIQRFFSNRDPGDLLLLYFSCHGVKDAAGQLYFVTTTTEFRFLAATALSSEFVSDQMRQCSAKRIVLMLDCCYSGAFARNAVVRAGVVVDVVERFEGRGRVVITASSAMEYAYDGDELVANQPQPSIFTSAVVEGLETGEADRDGDGRVSVDELYDYVLDAVRDRTPHQNPNKISTVEGSVYIARNPHRGRRDPDVVMGLRPISGRRLSLALGNDGVAAVDLALTASVSPPGPRAVIEPQRLRLRPGEHGTADVRLNAHRPLFGQTRRHTVTVHGNGGGRDWSAEAHLVVRPWLTRRRLAAGVAIAIVLAAAAVLAFREPGPDRFPIKHDGRIDTPGKVDRYTFRVRAGQVIYFDDQDKYDYPSRLAWTLLDPDGEPVFKDRGLAFDGDVGPVTLKTTGRYELSVFGHGDAVGDYKFELYDVSNPQSFSIAIGDQIYPATSIADMGWLKRPGADATKRPGAAHIETPGAVDEYVFRARAGQVVYFDDPDEFDYPNGLAWTLIDPDGRPVFEDKSLEFDGDVGPVTLNAAGDYKLRIFGHGDTVGGYTFKVWDVPPAQSFPITIGDHVQLPDSSGTGWVDSPDGSRAPRAGAGRVESPGAVDEYVFHAQAGQVIYLHEQHSYGPDLGWTLLGPDGQPVFQDKSMSSDDTVGPITLKTTGDYKLRVFGRRDATGDYAFELRPA
jgi:Caspase domain